MNPENTTNSSPLSISSQPSVVPSVSNAGNQGKFPKGLIYGVIVIIVLMLLGLGYVKLKSPHTVSTPGRIIDTHVYRTQPTSSSNITSSQPQASPIVINNSEELDQTLNQVKNLNPKSLNATVQQNQSDASQFSQ